MAIVDCFACGNKISEAATICPKCGHPVQRQTPAPAAKPQKGTPLLVWLVLGVLGLYYAAKFERFFSRPASETSEAPTAIASPAQAPQRGTITIDPGDLLSEYQANEIRTNDKLNGKFIHVSGFVTDIGEMLGDPYVEIDSGDRYHAVHANFKPEARSAIAQLSKGSGLSVTCDHAAFILSSPVLYKCEVQ